jgi:hypothetical protein
MNAEADFSVPNVDETDDQKYFFALLRKKHSVK